MLKGIVSFDLLTKGAGIEAYYGDIQLYDQ